MVEGIFVTTAGYGAKTGTTEVAEGQNPAYTQSSNHIKQRIYILI